MKNLKLKTSHPIVLSAAIVLTVLSIVGSIAIADLVPASDAPIKASDEKVHKSNPPVSSDRSTDDNAYVSTTRIAKVDYEQNTVSSVVKPKLTDCFNCGVVVAIETIPGKLSARDTADTALKPHAGDLFNNHLDNYLDAHRKNARLIVLDKSKAESSTEANTKASTDLSRNHDGNAHAKEAAYIIKVRMQNGRHLTVNLNAPPQQKIGDKVRIINERTITA